MNVLTIGGSPPNKHIKFAPWEATDYRHAWWLNYGWIDRQEGAILGVSTGNGQISNAPGLGCVVNLFLYLVEW